MAQAKTDVTENSGRRVPPSFRRPTPLLCNCLCWDTHLKRRQELDGLEEGVMMKSMSCQAMLWGLSPRSEGHNRQNRIRREAHCIPFRCLLFKDEKEIFNYLSSFLPSHINCFYWKLTTWVFGCLNHTIFASILYNSSSKGNLLGEPAKLLWTYFYSLFRAIVP